MQVLLVVDQSSVVGSSVFAVAVADVEDELAKQSQGRLAITAADCENHMAGIADVLRAFIN